MLFDFEVVKYIDELIEKSSHIYVGIFKNAEIRRYYLAELLIKLLT